MTIKETVSVISKIYDTPKTLILINNVEGFCLEKCSNFDNFGKKEQFSKTKTWSSY